MEDDPVTRGLLQETLLRAGHSVAVAPDALEGLNTLRRERPDALVVDLILPGMSGATMLTAEEAAAVPRLVVITAADPGRDFPGLPARARVLRKPFEAAALAAEVGGGS